MIYLLTAISYIVDILKWGTFLGLLLMSVAFFEGTPLDEAFIKGILVYWFIDSILAKIREEHIYVKREYNKDLDKGDVL